MVHLREAASTIRSKINVKINDAISNFRDPPPPAKYQQQHQQTPNDDEDETLSTFHRLVLARKRNATSFSLSSSTPSPSNPPSDSVCKGVGTGERTTKVMESIISTMFGVCSGTQHETCNNTGPQCHNPSMYYCNPSGNYNQRNNYHKRQEHDEVLHCMQKRSRRPTSIPATIIQHTPPQRRSSPKSTKHIRKSKKTAHFQQEQQEHQQQSKHLNGDHNYTHFYDDDNHAEPTRAVPDKKLSVSRHHRHYQSNEWGVDSSKGRNPHHQISVQRRINVITPEKAEENRIARAKNVILGQNKQVRQEHIDVGGIPYRLTELSHPDCADDIRSYSCGDGVGSSLEEEKEEGGTARSYSFDDGISALSAHTLEDMAERELFLDRIKRIPMEEGFDITDEANAGVGDCITIGRHPESCVTTNLDTSAKKAPCSPQEQKKGNSKEERKNKRRSTFPVQMARNRSESSKQSSKSDFSDVWMRQERQHWKRVVEKNESSEFTITSDVAKNESKAKTPLPEHASQHPHETMLLTTSDVVPYKKKKKKRNRTMFGRRKGYMTYEEEENIVHSPPRLIGSAFAEV